MKTHSPVLLTWNNIFPSTDGRKTYWTCPGCHSLKIPWWEGQRWFLPRVAESLGGIQLSILVSRQAKITGGNWDDWYRSGSNPNFILIVDFLLIQDFCPNFYFFNIVLRYYLSWFLSFLASPSTLFLRQLAHPPYPNPGSNSEKLKREESNWPSL